MKTAIVVVLSLFVLVAHASAANYTVSQSYVDAIDAATAAYVATTEWATAMTNFGSIFSVPTCVSPKPSWPSKFDFSKTNMTLCYELETNPPWDKVHEKAGHMLVDQLNKHYGLSITPVFVKLNTTNGGYMKVLQGATDDGSCDVCIASTNYNAERAALVHFQCMYGSSAIGMLRSMKDLNNLTITDEKDINKTGVIVGTFGGTSYDQYVTKTFQAATIVRVDAGWVSVFEMVKNRQIHVMIAESTDLYVWLGNNRGSCVNCTTKPIGDPFSYSSFVTRNIRSHANTSYLTIWAIVFLSFIYAFVF